MWYIHVYDYMCKYMFIACGDVLVYLRVYIHCMYVHVGTCVTIYKYYVFMCDFRCVFAHGPMCTYLPLRVDKVKTLEQVKDKR